LERKKLETRHLIQNMTSLTEAYNCYLKIAHPDGLSVVAGRDVRNAFFSGALTSFKFMLECAGDVDKAKALFEEGRRAVSEDADGGSEKVILPRSRK
jgi:hypothetical protein